jgi:hypothetical protein
MFLRRRDVHTDYVILRGKSDVEANKLAELCTDIAGKPPVGIFYAGASISTNTGPQLTVSFYGKIAGNKRGRDRIALSGRRLPGIWPALSLRPQSAASLYEAGRAVVFDWLPVAARLQCGGGAYGAPRIRAPGRAALAVRTAGRLFATYHDGCAFSFPAV